jgi:uncharacterized protein YbbK (DUF523 family)
LYVHDEALMSDIQCHQYSRPLVAISACLLGQRVRYDGAEKKDELIVGQLSKHVEWLPLCPEVGIGLAVPRPPIQLVSKDNIIRIIAVDELAMDVTDQLAEYARQQALEHPCLCGYIFKSRSPSCGLGDLPVHDVLGESVAENGIGEFARVFQQQRKDVPVIDELQFRDRRKATEFINAVEKIFTKLSIR